MIAYNATEFEPPAPIALVTLVNERNNMAVSGVMMQLDTGADVTLIPDIVVPQLDLDQLNTTYELVGFDGSRSLTSAVHLRMQFDRYAIRGNYLLTDQAVGIIGRDVLNLMALLFDGPKGQWHIFRESDKRAYSPAPSTNPC